MDHNYPTNFVFSFFGFFAFSGDPRLFLSLSLSPIPNPLNNDRDELDESFEESFDDVEADESPFVSLLSLSLSFPNFLKILNRDVFSFFSGVTVDEVEEEDCVELPLPVVLIAKWRRR